MTAFRTAAVVLALVAAFGAGAATVPDLAHNNIGLWFAASTCTIAAFLTGVGAMSGIIKHRFPRILLAVATAFVAVSYWLDIAGWHGIGEDMRRGAAFLLWPSLSWTAWSGIVYSRRAVAEAEATRRVLLDEEP